MRNYSANFTSTQEDGMDHVFVRHRVDDYPKWKEIFDNFIDTRKSYGEKSFQVLQHDEDMNNLFLMFAWDNKENAQRFFESSELRDTMQRAGVAEAPEIHFLNEADKGDL
jgi:heme-degrading monooxygenase HmoA